MGDEIKRMRPAWNVALVGNKRETNRVLWGGLKERVHIEELDVDRRIILKRNFKW